MQQLPSSIIAVIALLTFFLVCAVGLKYAMEDYFERIRLTMTLFFCFIVLTLTISFWQYTLDSLPLTIPAALMGVAIGYYVGVKAEKEKLETSGVEYYMEHFAHVHIKDIASLTWWSIFNFYTIAAALLLINLVGLSSVIFQGDEESAIRTCAVGALLLGTVVPYLFHLWSVSSTQNASKNISEK